MLFGQWEDENDRQRRQLKTKMYKEMLDNQILINERYRREKRGNEEPHNHSQISEKRPLFKKEARQHLKTENNHADLDLTLSKIRTKSNHINLPSIKDKNTYYQGSSKFIKVDEPSSKPAKPASQSPFHADLIEDDEQDLDEYNNTCEKIIRELKDINKQSPKMKYRRKLYEYSDLAPNRKRYEKTKIEQLKKSEVQLYNKYDYVRTNPKQDSLKQQFTTTQNASVRSKIASEDRVPSFSVVSPQRQQLQSSKPRSEKPIFNQSKLKPKQEYPANEFEEVSQENSAKATATRPKMMTESSDSSNMQISSNLPAKVNNLDRSRMKSNIDVSKPNQIIQQNDKSKPMPDLKLHKQNFINLLRKVKNRGQSLFIKLNAFPTKNDSKSDK